MHDLPAAIERRQLLYAAVQSLLLPCPNCMYNAGGCSMPCCIYAAVTGTAGLA